MGTIIDRSARARFGWFTSFTVGVFALLVGTLGLAARDARADTLYSTLGPGDSFDNTSPSYDVSGTSSPNGGFQAVAGDFTLSTAATLDSAELAMVDHGGTDQADISLWTSVGSGIGIPGVLLYTGSSVAPTTAGGLVTSTFGGVALAANTEYWLVAQPHAASTYLGWYLNDQGIDGWAVDVPAQQTTKWFKESNSTAPAFRINGTGAVATPNPQAASAGVVLLAGLVAHRAWRRKRAGDSNLSPSL